MTQGEGVDATCAVVYMSEGHTALLAKLLIKNKVPCHSERKIPNTMRSTWVIQARKYHRKYGEYGVETTDNAMWSKIHKFKILGNSNNTQKQPSLHDKGNKSTLKELKLNYKKKPNDYFEKYPHMIFKIIHDKERKVVSVTVYQCPPNWKFSTLEGKFLRLKKIYLKCYVLDLIGHRH